MSKKLRRRAAWQIRDEAEREALLHVDDDEYDEWVAFSKRHAPSLPKRTVQAALDDMMKWLKK